MGNVGIELGPAGVAFGRPFFVELCATLAAIKRAEVILRMTARAAVGQFAAGHGDKRPFGSLNDFQVTNDEAAIESDRTKGLKAIVRIVHEFDANFSDFHNRAPSRCCLMVRQQ
jgi:hypothetical protein